MATMILQRYCLLNAGGDGPCPRRRKRGKEDLGEIMETQAEELGCQLPCGDWCHLSGKGGVRESSRSLTARDACCCRCAGWFLDPSLARKWARLPRNCVGC